MRRTFAIIIQVLFIGAFVIFSQDTDKPLTNSDILEMVKAGLPESTIILTIERSQGKYDTSATALIALNNAGVPAKVLDAMVKASNVPPQSNTPITNQVSSGAFQQASTVSSVSGGVLFVNGDDKTQMKRMTPKTKTNSGATLIPYAGIFMKAKSYSVFNGRRSDVRTGNTQPEFEVAIAADLKASDAVGIVRLDTEGDTRRILILEAGAFGGKSGSRKKDIMPVSLSELGTNGGLTIYKLTPRSPLTPGEYAVVVSGLLFYDFAIDVIP